MPLLTNNNQNPKRNFLSLIISLIFLGGVLWAFLNYQSIYDWWQLRNFTPSNEISAIATQDTMTSYATHIFYVNHSTFNDKSVFNNNCPNKGGELTIILGCYHDHETGIFLLTVTDPRLDGVEQVTAAHEMLHAAYERLSQSEKDKVDAMLLDYYNNDLKDSRILDTIAAYKKSEPKDIVNEMHSIFGTEIASLPAPLESYYTKYFRSRPQIAAFAAKYQNEFTSRQAAITQDDAQLASLKSQIDNLEADLKSKLANINSLQSQLNSLKSSGDINSYNSLVPEYNSQVDVYNANVGQLKDTISRYNALVDSRNNISLSENQLYQALSGNTPTINR